MVKSKLPRRSRRRRSPANDNPRPRTLAATRSRAQKRAKVPEPEDGGNIKVTEADLSAPAEFLLPLLDDDT